VCWGKGKGKGGGGLKCCHLFHHLIIIPSFLESSVIYIFIGNYAHGAHELKHRYTSVILMERSGQIVDAKRHLALPCPTWVATGACPFGRRCGSSECDVSLLFLLHNIYNDCFSHPQRCFSSSSSYIIQFTIRTFQDR
jgi:hypothetical protein